MDAVGRLQPAVAAQDGQLAGDAALAELVRQRLDVALHLRLDVAVGDGGEGPLVLAQLGQHVRRQRHRDAGQHLGGDLGDPLLVRGVGEGVDQRDGQRLDAAAGQLLELGPDVGVVERADHRPVAGDPLVDLDGVLQVGQRLGLGPDDPAGQPAGHVGAGDLQDLPEALRGDQADGGALALEDRVGRDRGAVQHLGDLGQLDPRRGADLPDPVEDADRLVGGGRGGLGPPRAAAALLDQQDVGERAPDVDSEPVTHEASSVLGCCAVVARPRTMTARALERWAVMTACAHAGSPARTAATISRWWPRLRRSDVLVVGVEVAPHDRRMDRGGQRGGEGGVGGQGDQPVVEGPVQRDERVEVLLGAGSADLDHAVRRGRRARRRRRRWRSGRRSR